MPLVSEQMENGLPTSPMWKSEGGAWSGDESVSSSGSREGNVGNDALHVIECMGLVTRSPFLLKD